MHEKAVTGPYMIDKDNRQYRVHIGDEGWDILEEGPVRAVLRTKGKHYDDQGKAGLIIIFLFMHTVISHGSNLITSLLTVRKIRRTGNIIILN